MLSARIGRVWCQMLYSHPRLDGDYHALLELTALRICRRIAKGRIKDWCMEVLREQRRHLTEVSMQ
jgi:hypothetical protein